MARLALARVAIVAAADADIAALLETEQLGTGMHATAEQYRLLARALAAAREQRDWTSVQRLSSEMRQTRALLMAKEVRPSTDDDLEHFLARAASEIRNATQPGA